MQAAKLFNQGAAVNLDYFSLREALRKSLTGYFVHFITIYRQQYGLIDDQEINQLSFYFTKA